MKSGWASWIGLGFSTRSGGGIEVEILLLKSAGKVGASGLEGAIDEGLGCCIRGRGPYENGVSRCARMQLPAPKPGTQIHSASTESAF